ncbi:lysM and putative peptidoglycan-binding domain-containing protein 1 isoform X2 [Nyctibius grandis]|uniref:lysM and putative peptidoglycan-binding domain-containing protein 1 isoform X2 n=1 Tax=Nyctibius grandis TaxID=48427 RepID=UPI0035BC538F
MAAGSGAAGASAREHRLEPGDTLAGLALRYGVTMEQIKRANRLYTSDTIFLKPTLLIPAPAQPGGPCPEDTDKDVPVPTGDVPATPAPSRHDLSATDFLRQLDAEIGRSKAAAAAQRLRAGGPGATPPRPLQHSRGRRHPGPRRRRPTSPPGPPPRPPAPHQDPAGGRPPRRRGRDLHAVTPGTPGPPRRDSHPAVTGTPGHPQHPAPARGYRRGHRDLGGGTRCPLPVTFEGPFPPEGHPVPGCRASPLAGLLGGTGRHWEVLGQDLPADVFPLVVFIYTSLLSGGVGPPVPVPGPPRGWGRSPPALRACK